MKIIGIAGPARSGKDTAGDYLINTCGFTRLSFAQPLKDMVCALLGCDEKFIELNKDFHLSTCGYSPRELLQTLGTEWGRQTLHQNFWVDILEHKLNDLTDQACEGVVITDVRFENEADMIRRQGGIIVHVSRSDAPIVAEHVSETGVRRQASDCLLENEGSIMDLYMKVNALVDLYPKLTMLWRG